MRFELLTVPCRPHAGKADRRRTVSRLTGRRELFAGNSYAANRDVGRPGGPFCENWACFSLAFRAIRADTAGMRTVTWDSFWFTFAGFYFKNPGPGGFA